MTDRLPFFLPRLSVWIALLAGLSSGLIALEATAAPPAPVAPIITSAATRFTNNNNGTVTDSITGLIWLKSANCIGQKTWSDATIAAASLASGICGLNDGSTAGQWRLPSRNELQSLIDYTTSDPALPAGYPFTDIQSDYYWSSTTSAGDSSGAWLVGLNDGYVGANAKSSHYDVWPVRGGL